MSYRYEDHRHVVLTEQGQIILFKVHRLALKLIDASGCVRAQKLLDQGVSDSWEAMAFVDHLVAVGELREVWQGHATTGCSHHRLFVRDLS